MECAIQVVHAWTVYTYLYGVVMTIIAIIDKIIMI